MTLVERVEVVMGWQQVWPMPSKQGSGSNDPRPAPLALG